MAIRKQQTVTFSTRVRMDVRARYLLYLPEGYGELRQMWPLVLFLHGAGERGSDVNASAARPSETRVTREKSSLSFSSRRSVQRMNRGLFPVVRALLDEVQDRYAGRFVKVYLTGLSMGGERDVATGNDVSGTVRSSCAGLRLGRSGPRMCPEGCTRLGFHGRKDRVVPFRKSEEMVKALRGLRRERPVYCLPDAAHDSWTETYSNPAFFKWLLDQRLSPPTRAGRGFQVRGGNRTKRQGPRSMSRVAGVFRCLGNGAGDRAVV